MSDGVVIGIGNSFRRDDGVGLAVVDDIARRGLSDVRVLTATGEPGVLLDAWTGAGFAVVVDAALGEGASPGRIRRWTPGDDAESSIVSSHALGLPQTYALGEALGRLPERLVGLTVDIVDAGYGVGFTPEVAAAIPAAVEAVLAEIAVQDPRGVDA